MSDIPHRLWQLEQNARDLPVLGWRVTDLDRRVTSLEQRPQAQTKIGFSTIKEAAMIAAIAGMIGLMVGTRDPAAVITMLKLLAGKG